MKCIAYIETKTHTLKGKPYKSPRTSQVGTIYHTTLVEATDKGWIRCDGELNIEIKHVPSWGCSCCGEEGGLECNVTCSNCKFKGSEWALTGFINRCSIEDMVNEAMQEKYL